MTHRKENYADLSKYRKTLYKQRKRYYGKSAIYPASFWTEEQEQMVLTKRDKDNNELTDNEISKLIKHSVAAIQKKRSRLKKELHRK